MDKIEPQHIYAASAISLTFPIYRFAFPSNYIHLIQPSFYSWHFIDGGSIEDFTAVFLPYLKVQDLAITVFNRQRITAIERLPFLVLLHKPANSIGFEALYSV